MFFHKWTFYIELRDMTRKIRDMTWYVSSRKYMQLFLKIDTRHWETQSRAPIQLPMWAERVRLLIVLV